MTALHIIEAMLLPSTLLLLWLSFYRIPGKNC
jgi:hypothetical protein